MMHAHLGLPARPGAGLAIAAVLLVPFLFAARPAAATPVNGAGLVDYRHKNFRVGDWVRYRIESSDTEGHERIDYQTIKIVGEETFRGEPCFWIETSYGPENQAASVDISMMSAEVFKDPDADVRFSLYLRMTLFGL